MAHVRKQIRDWLKANLTGSAEAGSRVYVRRTLPRPKGAGAALLISIVNEGSEDISMEARQQRAEQVQIVAAVKGDGEAGEDTLDALGVFVEGVFAASPTLGGVAHDYEYQGAEFAFTGEGEDGFCTAAFNFVVMVETGRDDPETAL